LESDIVAGVFGKIFTILANDPQHYGELAKSVWSICQGYHFDLFLMGCDDSLVKLGLGVRDAEGLMKYHTE